MPVITELLGRVRLGLTPSLPLFPGRAPQPQGIVGEELEAHQPPQPGGLHGTPQLRAGHEPPGGHGESHLDMLVQWRGKKVKKNCGVNVDEEQILVY